MPFAGATGKMTKRTRIGALLWVFCLQYFVAEAITIQGWAGRYSLRENYISDLSAVRCGAELVAGQIRSLCSPLHAVMNEAFQLQGALILFGTLLVRPLFPTGKVWTVALVLIAASGVGVFLVGLAPEDALPKLHLLGAAANLFCCNAGMAAMGLAMMRRGRTAAAIGRFTLGAGLLGLAGFGCLAVKLNLGFGVGGIERITAYPFPLWIATMGLLLLRQGGLPGAIGD